LELLQRTVNRTKLRWTINSFDPHKSDGPCLIIAAFLQHGTDVLSSLPCSIFRACIALGYISTAWRKARVTFIPKPGKPRYTKTKAYRPICLSSFLLKTLERLEERKTYWQRCVGKKYFTTLTKIPINRANQTIQR